MKRKNVSSQSLTKADLESALEKYPTKEDLRIEIKFNTDDVLAKVDENARKYRDEILTSNDKLMKKLGEMQDENTIGSGQTSQLREEIENHEKRIKHLEKVQNAV